MITGDAVTSVTFTSGGAISTATVGTYTIVPSAATGTHLANYNISYTNGTFTVNGNPTASAAQGAPIYCWGGTTTLTVSGTGGTGTYSGIGTFTRFAGAYSYTIVDGNNCIATTSGIITQNTNVTFTTTPVNPSPCTAINGKITVLAAGGSGFYYFSKDNGVTFGTSTLFTNLPAGTYTMQVKDSRNCTSIKTAVRVGCLVRIEDGQTADPSTTFNVYPNPASDHLTIDFSSESNESCNVRLIDMIGQVVSTQTINSVVGDNQMQLKLEGISKGIYMVSIQKGDSKLLKRIVIQ